MKKKIIYISGREGTYSRTRTVHQALIQAGYDVIGIFPPNKNFHHYPGLIRRFLCHKRKADLIVVGFYGQILLPFVRLLTKRPILYDLYISTFDTMVSDRKTAKAGSLKAKLYWWADALTMRWADRIILETNDHIADFAERFRIPIEKFEHLFLALDEALIKSEKKQSTGGSFLAHFHGEYAPFHGVSTIIRAAKLLETEDVHFEIIGTGITYERDRSLAESLELRNVTFIDWVPYDELGDSMNRADCCLGIFGDNLRTQRVLTNKVIEALAVSKPLITVRNRPVLELVQDGESALLVNPADPQDLADAILKLKNDPDLGNRIGQKGHEAFLTHCTLQVFQDRLSQIVEGMTA